MRRLISASELGTWCYCQKAWRFQRLGYPSSLGDERIAGTKHHETRHQRLRSARRQRAVSRIVILLCGLVLILMAIRRVFPR